jgi:Ca2+:H+ antiporter
MQDRSNTTRRIGVRSELACWAGLATVLIFFTVGAGWLDDLSHPAWLTLVFAWILAAITWAAFAAVRHADKLAIQLGEPYGTLVLTLAVNTIEVVMIIAVMTTGSGYPTLARDTMFSVIMVQLNGLIGLALLLGGIRYREQFFNLQGNTAYLTVIVTLAGLSLVLPRFTESTPDGSHSTLLLWFVVFASIILYGAFLGIQTMRHRDYFKNSDEDGADLNQVDREITVRSPPQDSDTRSIGYHAFFLVLILTVITLLADKFALVIDYSVAKVGAPIALTGLIIALIAPAPEGLSALRAALANNLQRSVNVIFGGTLSTIGLTVPAVLIASYFLGQEIELGLSNLGIVLLALTVTVSLINATSQRTNILQGVTHLVLFTAYLVLIFD